MLEAVFALQPDDREAIAVRMNDYAARRREKQPLTYPSAGSTFKRPEGHFAGTLIEDAGLKGASVGGAQVSEKARGLPHQHGQRFRGRLLQLKDLVQHTVYEKIRRAAGTGGPDHRSGWMFLGRNALCTKRMLDLSEEPACEEKPAHCGKKPAHCLNG